MLDHADSSNVLKMILIESGLTEEQSEMKDSFSEDAIRDVVTNSPDRKAAVSKIKDNLVRMYAIFDNQKMQKIENTYSLFMMFNSFINFDFYFLLRKFDSRFPENDFVYNPNFESINGEYVSDDLKDFLESFILISSDC